MTITDAHRFLYEVAQVFQCVADKRYDDIAEHISYAEIHFRDEIIGSAFYCKQTGAVRIVSDVFVGPHGYDGEWCIEFEGGGYTPIGSLCKHYIRLRQHDR